jgi:hypothetical protein
MMRDPIADILIQHFSCSRNAADFSAKQIRKLMADKACEAVHHCSEWRQREIQQAIRKALEVDDE